TSATSISPSSASAMILAIGAAPRGMPSTNGFCFLYRISLSAKSAAACWRFLKTISNLPIHHMSKKSSLSPSERFALKHTPRPGSNVVFSDERHRARLRPLFPFLFSKTDFRPDLQIFEPAVQHAVSMEVDLPAVRGLQKAVSFFRKELSDPSMWRCL